MWRRNRTWRSQRLAGIEVAAWNLDALGGEVDEEARPDAGRLKVPLHGAVLQRPGADVLVDLLHLQDVAFHAGDFGDAHHAALAVGQARQLDDDADRGRDLAADAGDRHRQAGHADHLLEARERVTRRVGVNG